MKGLIFTYVLTILGIVGGLKKPKIGLFVYVAFAVLRPHFLWGFAGTVAGISWYVGMATAVGWAIKGFGSWNFGKALIPVILLVGFTVWAAISTMLALSPTTAQGALDAMVKYVMPFLVGATLIRGALDARQLMWVIVGAQGYVAWEMNLAYLQGQNRVRDFGFGGMDNNCFGIALVSTLGPAIALALSSKTWKGRTVAAACTALILHTILLTFSRGAMVTIPVVLAAGFFMIPLRPKNIAAILVVALLALRLTGPELMARFQTTFANEEGVREGSAQSRVSLWRDCFTVASSYPIFGVGPNNWPIVAPQFGWTSNKSAHSAWMQTMAETGFPGLGLLLSFFAVVMMRLFPIAWQWRRGTDKDGAVLAVGVIMCIVGFVVSAQFVTLQGLEIPYYVALAGVALMTARVPVPVEAKAAVAPTRRPLAYNLPTPGVRF